jgi:hypothetical protein
VKDQSRIGQGCRSLPGALWGGSLLWDGRVRSPFIFSTGEAEHGRAPSRFLLFPPRLKNFCKKIG